MHDHLIVAAVLRKQGQILLVESESPDDARQEWALPTGTAEPGELLIESLRRTVREETGLEVVRVGDLISLSQAHYSSNYAGSGQAMIQPGDRATTFVFEVAEWQGDFKVSDLDGLQRAARFWPRNEAIDLLQGVGSHDLQEPLVAYLRGGKADRVWLYRHDIEGSDTLVWPTSEPPPEVNEQLRRARAFVALGCIVILAILVIIIVIGVITLARPFA